MANFFIGGTLTDQDVLNPKAKSQPGELFFNYILILYHVPKQDPTFVITQTSAAAKKPATVAFSSSDTSFRKLPDAKNPQVGIYLVRVKVPAGVTMTVNATLPSDPAFPRQDVFAFDPTPNTSSAVQVFGRSENPPRLVLALNSTTVPDPPGTDRFKEFAKKKGGNFDFANPGSVEIRYLLNYIHDRLAADFVAPWFGPDGGPMSAIDSTSDLPKDEQWARKIAELSTKMPYITPTTAYQSTIGGPNLLDQQLLSKLQDDGDPAYPIVGECQHHATMALLGRGFEWSLEQKPGKDGVIRPKMKAMLTAGPSGAMITSINSATPGVQWIAKQNGTTALSQLDQNFQPGSSFTFQNPVMALDPRTGSLVETFPQNPEDHPHIAYVIRVVRDAQKVLRVQFFDVGGMNISEPHHPAMPKIGSVYEYPLSATGKEGAKGAYAGTVEVTKNEAALDKGIDRLSRARPIGVVRLVIGRRINTTTGKPVDRVHDPMDGWLLYASPLLRMYETDGTLNYSIARLLWSLRELPGGDQLQAIWQISTPRGELADAMTFGLGPASNRRPTGRGVKMSELIADVAARKPGLKLRTDGTATFPPQSLALGVIDVANEIDGSVMVLESAGSDSDSGGKKFTFLKRDLTDKTTLGNRDLAQLPVGKPTTKASTVDLSTFTDIPPYFNDQS
jgi:hypothetical protein